MRVIVNFEPEEVPGETVSIADLLRIKRYTFPLIIARIDGRLIERADYETTLVSEGDEVELYHLVSGG
ncbi:MAG: sulfur carrier protein ThiS [Spirochaetales bacterium]|nr:sulfur carrier protein ThiS [Spirochaetales bacterium]